MSRTLFVVLVFCLLMTLVSWPNSTSAQERTVGVSKDDWFRYNVVLDWSSSDQNATIPDYLKPFVEVEWFLVTTKSVSGTNVTFMMLAHMKNGTEYPPQELSVDVETGCWADLWIIAANLDPNNTLYADGKYSSWTIQETVDRTYPEGTRETNHACNTTELDWTEVHVYSFLDLFWDRSTGIVVEGISNIQRTETDGSQKNISIVMTITESNVWTISNPETVPEFPALTLMPLILIALAVASVFYKRRLIRIPVR